MAEKQMLKEMERKIKNLFLKIRLGALVKDRWPENSCLKKWRGGRGGMMEMLCWAGLCSLASSTVPA